MNRRVIPIAMDTIFTKGWKNSGTVSCFSCMMKRCHQTIHWPSGKLANTKQKQAIVFRSDEALAYLCEAMGLFQSMRLQGINLYTQLSQIFDRPKPKRSTV